MCYVSPVWSTGRFMAFPIEAIDWASAWTPRYRWKRLKLLTLGVGDSPLLPLTSIQNNGNAEFRPRLSRWLQSGKFAEIGNLWFALGVRASWSKVMNGKDNYRVLPRRNLEAIGAVVSPIQILIFWMLRSNADARRCSYFELGLPVVYLTCSWTPK